MIRVADHRESIVRILAHYGLSGDALEVVPSVFEWCQAQGVPETNERRMAKCFCDWKAGTCRIVMCESFSQQAFANSNAAMETHGFYYEVQTLTSPKLNLLHLLLHEIAAHTLRTYEQEPRDVWAFSEMGKHDI